MRNTAYITNVFPDDNKGGAAITSATIEAVMQALPDADVVLIATQVDKPAFDVSHRFTLARHPTVRMQMPLVAVTGRRLAGLRAVVRSLPLVFGRPERSRDRHIRDLARASLVVSKGGYVFVERHSVRRMLRIWLSALPLLVASRGGATTIAIGATVGPFSKWYSRALNGWILRKLDLVIPRDELSYREALSLGVEADRMVQLPDVVFSHPCPSAEDTSRVLERTNLVGKRFAAITVIRGPGDAQYLPAVRRVMSRLLDDAELDAVAVVVQATEDVEVSRDFHATFADERVLLVDQDLAPAELIALYGGARFVIARRMHSAIFSLIAGAPTLATVFLGRKVQGVMASLGLEEFLLPYSDVDAEELLARVQSMLEREHFVRARVRRAVDNAAHALQHLPAAIQRAVQLRNAPRSHRSA